MSDTESYKPEGSGLDRRSFLKNAGVAVAAGGAMSAGLTITATQPAAAAAGTAAFVPAALAAAAYPGMKNPVTTTLNVNGREQNVVIEPHWTLQRTLQFALGLTGAKQMCDRGACGSCTVIVDGRAVLSCTMLAVECVGKKIETVEGIAADAKWKPLIDAYCKWDAMQCGYCTPGFVVSAKALLVKNPNPTEEDCRQALAGNICCCGTYPRHPTAIVEASANIK